MFAVSQSSGSASVSRDVLKLSQMVAAIMGGSSVVSFGCSLSVTNNFYVLIRLHSPSKSVGVTQITFILIHSSDEVELFQCALDTVVNTDWYGAPGVSACSLLSSDTVPFDGTSGGIR